MINEEQGQDIRAKFYNDPMVIRYLQTHGIPRTSHAFSDMVAAGSSEKLESKAGLALIACLGSVVFRSQPQQLNIMDKTNGKTISSITR